MPAPVPSPDANGAAPARPAVVVIETPELGDRSYLVHDGALAAAIDPQRDLDRVQAAADAAGVRIALVLETHLHNDYVTGGLELARRTGAPYVIGGGEEASFDCHPARDGERLAVGQLVLRVVATPGHTEAHVAYVLETPAGPGAVFTGGSLLFGTVGRTDLVAPAATQRLTRSQHASVRRLAEALPDPVAVHPTHGFGSFCSSVESSGAAASTVGEERRVNPALRQDDPEAFAEMLVAGLVAYPRYYRHMGLLNRAGPAALDLSPAAAVAPAELRARIDRGEWVLDLRDRRAFAEGHLAGTIAAELSSSFTTYLGWIVPWGMPLTLLATSAAQAHQAQRSLARIGVDRPAGLAVSPPAQLGGAMRSYPVREFADLALALRGGAAPTVLDVRRDDEWERGHIAGARHIHLPELVPRVQELPSDVPIWVHCAAGYRASLAASLLDRADRRPVLVDDEWERAAPSGLPITAGA